MPGNLQAPYGGPQTPYGGPQAPYGAPQDLQAPYGSPQAPYGAPDMGGSRYADVAESSGSVPLGLLLGAVIGVVGSIAVLKILFYAHFGLAWLYIGVGYGIGYGIWSQTRRGSVGLAFAAIGIMIASLFIAHLVYAGDILNQARAQGNADPGVTIFDALPVAMSSFSPMHWVCILIGLAACWRGVEQQSS